MTNNFKAVQIEATVVELHPNGRAIKFSNLKFEGVVKFSTVWMPFSKVSNIKMLDKKLKIVSADIPNWLWESKLGEEMQKEMDRSVFDQLGFKLSEHDANKQYNKKVVNTLDRE